MVLRVILDGSVSLAGLVLIFNQSADPLVSNIGFSLLGFILTLRLIPPLCPLFIAVGFKGRDQSKVGKPVLAETMGAVAACVFLMLMFLFIPFMFYKYLVTQTSGGGNRDQGVQLFDEFGRTLHRFPHDKLAQYLSGIMCLQSMVMLGVADDLFDIRWRNKLLLPVFAAVPMLVVYYVDFGVTHVILPRFLWPRFGKVLDLGGLYYIYMGAVAIFCPHSVNILAGVNGLEVGQSVVIACWLVINDLIYILGPPDSPAIDSHLASIYILLPFIGVSLALLYHNWFPARVFVGDTYCYFAGMVLAVVGIQGHFSKTLLLFFFPQIVNFIYSAPQLFRVVQCPRHRLPHFNSETGLLEASRVTFQDDSPPSKTATLVLRTFEKMGIARIWESKDGKIHQASNLTIINLVLVKLGPMREDKVTTILLLIQALNGALAMILRHFVARWVFGRDNYRI